ncbi:MAG: hypothetical protein H7X77_00735 [Anaerolineae bacterium]|nr:hypothetical protein [Anaerolineae bacterium]
MIDNISFDELVTLVENLPALEKVRLVERIMVTLGQELKTQPSQSLKSAYGLWADLNVDISAEDIDEARREMWGNFPREDI